MRFRDLIAELQAIGVHVETGAKHWKLTKPGFRPYTIPAHNGEKTMLSDIYVKKARKHFGA